MCQISTYQLVLQIAGVFGVAVLLGLLICYGVEWAGFVWRNNGKDGSNGHE